MELKLNYQDFESVIHSRDIKYLVHFTRFQSITAIIGERRILPRNKLHNVGYNWCELVMPNSTDRWDDSAYLNTSVMHPNVNLLNIFRYRYQGYRFCVVGIAAKYIYEEQTKFSITNATYSGAKNFGITGNFETFNALFMDIVPGRIGEETVRCSNLPSNYTTDPQAEILIRSEIPYDDIMFIACKSLFEHDLLASAFDVLDLPTEKICVEPALFEHRN